MKRSAALLLLLVPQVCGAQTQGAELILTRPPDPTAASPEIIGGKPTSATEWPATFKYTGTGGKICTATAIGPRVLLTAAHCIGSVTSGKIEDSVVIDCKKHDAERYGYDMALCVSQATIPVLNGRPYETLYVAAKPKQDEMLTLLGYGCTTNSGPVGFLYKGSSPVHTLIPFAPGFETKGGVSVCAGDSGGAAYSASGDSRSIVGIAAVAINQDQRSLFTSVSDPVIRAFIASWTKEQLEKKQIVVEICGVDPNLLVCQQ